MDFFKVKIRETTKGKYEIYPEFLSRKSKDLMTRGGKFYAVWDEAEGLWSTDIYRVVDLVDEALDKKLEEHREKNPYVRYMVEHTSGSFDAFLRYVRNNENNYKQLNPHLAFANTKVKKTDYISHRLDYALEPGDHSAWDDMVGKLYSPEELAKIEWAIGSIVAGDSVNIQKFLVLYGSARTGKSTVLHIIEKLFSGYTNVFDAKALGSNGQSFALEVFKENPLVGIQHDGDLSRIEDNTRLNSLVSHESMAINEKYKSSYNIRINTFLFMGTNNPVKISDSRSGLIRRLIDVQPTGELHSFDHYQILMSRIEFELGAIAHHCLGVYKKMGMNYYDNYRPTKMMYSTNVFYNFVEAYFGDLKDPDGITLKRAYSLYKEFCDDSNNKPMQMQTFREEMLNYYDEFITRTVVNGQEVYSLYRGFKVEKISGKQDPEVEEAIFKIDLTSEKSLLDDILADQKAQYANRSGNPRAKWENVTTKLSDLDTSQLHFVTLPENHIVIDFDLTDEDGNKSLDLNLDAASIWPSTYAELSKSGQGLHLHYIYNGNVSELANKYSPGIEIKTLLGNASLRRRLSRCNDVPISKLTSGLPIKEKRMLDTKEIKTEKGLRDLIWRNLRKEIHPGTKPSIDFIKHILDEAYESELSYDVSDLRSRIIAFANNSTNRPLECLKIVQTMKFKSESQMRQLEEVGDDILTFFDVEVYPNLLVVCWNHSNSDEVVRMIQPTSEEIEALFRMKLVGFNNRRYDNHILYARFLGYDNERLYKLSQDLINNNKNAPFGEAYNLSYCDVYDFTSKKQSLKKYQMDLGLVHKELDIPWDQPVPEERWLEVADYCANDVITTKQTFESRRQDFIARQILAKISGLTVNDTTLRHTARLIFGTDPAPQKSFVYTDLSEMFPGYSYDMGVSTYRDENPSEGGYVYAEPGIYENVAVLDVASMHPTSIIELNLFGREYTRRFSDLVKARLAIKHKKYEEARSILGSEVGELIESDTNSADSLAYALKIVINIVYGLTSAKFDNPFRDIRNKDNIVAKRGALFMIDLKHYIQEQGFSVVHIKTDSVKIPNATPEIIKLVEEFGADYGYTFEHETTYSKFCLVNNAVYIAKEETPDGVKWDAVGAQFQHYYVYNKLFTGEPIDKRKLCEPRSVIRGAIYIYFGGEGDMHFVGRTGCFFPVMPNAGGGTLYRVNEGRKYAVAGTKGYLWKEAAVVMEMGEEGLDAIDMRYYDTLVEEAVETIELFGSFDEFVS